MDEIGILRTIGDGELELMRSWRNAPAVRNNMYTRHEITSAEHLAWWSRTRDRDDQQYFMYEINDQPLGIVGFTMIDHVNKNCSWAFYASPDAPRGTGLRMEYLALEQVFRKLNLHKLYCEVLASNPSVIKLHQKFGFQVEGVFREQHLLDETFIDIYRFGLFDHEWEIKRDVMYSKLMPKARKQV
jgi:UDP-4-amino-4,6-dideoxy-N-acetyl-beta-L-altrosamine N-acetyltransferase